MTGIPFALSADDFRFWAVDYVHDQITIVKQDGEKYTEQLSLPEEERLGSDIACTIFDWEKWWITIVTKRQDIVFWLGYNPESGDPFPTRPIVYLDQNQWSQVATALADPERIENQEERSAALELVRLASDDGIVLPLSSAHLVETSALHTKRRYEIGIAMAKLAGGWQMRHPWDVFEHETALALAGYLKRTFPHPRSPVISTEPYAWRGNDLAFGLGARPLPDLETFKSMLIAPAVVVSLLIDPEPSERVLVTKWIEHHQRIGKQISALDQDKFERSRTARRRFWNEHLDTYRKALATVYESEEIPLFSDRRLRSFLSETPMISLLSELFVQRFIDKRAMWKHNDLIDMLFLSCAAGHCDYVVAEARTGTQLRQIQRAQGKPETVHTSLSDLVSALHDAGVTTDTERRRKA